LGAGRDRARPVPLASSANQPEAPSCGAGRLTKAPMTAMMPPCFGDERFFRRFAARAREFRERVMLDTRRCPNSSNSCSGDEVPRAIRRSRSPLEGCTGLSRRGALLRARHERRARHAISPPCKGEIPWDCVVIDQQLAKNFVCSLVPPHRGQAATLTEHGSSTERAPPLGC
jgi:hypothetical protein